MRPAVSAELQALLDEGHRQGLYSGAAAGVSVHRDRALAYAGTLAVDDATPVDAGTRFDLASVSKTFTGATLARLAAQGRLQLDEPVDRIRPVGTGSGAERITLRMLLTHVSGLPAESFLWRDDTVPEVERIDRLLSTPLESRPDELYRYSCVGYIAAGAVAERATGSSLSSLIDELIGRPLRLDSVTYGPLGRGQVAATEAQPWAGRGMLRGEVHDELNRYLGGRVGNAGLFATAKDVLSFAESFTDDAFYEPYALNALVSNGLRKDHGAAFGQGLGPRIGDEEFLGDVDGLGHIGFTGTMWFAAPGSGLAAVLLTNNVHPHRGHADIADLRRRFVSWAADLAQNSWAADLAQNRG